MFIWDDGINNSVKPYQQQWLETRANKTDFCIRISSKHIILIQEFQTEYQAGLAKKRSTGSTRMLQEFQWKMSFRYWCDNQDGGTSRILELGIGCKTSRTLTYQTEVWSCADHQHHNHQICSLQWAAPTGHVKVRLWRHWFGVRCQAAQSRSLATNTNAWQQNQWQNQWRQNGKSLLSRDQ